MHAQLGPARVDARDVTSAELRHFGPFRFSLRLHIYLLGVLPFDGDALGLLTKGTPPESGTPPSDASGATANGVKASTHALRASAHVHRNS